MGTFYRGGHFIRPPEVRNAIRFITSVFWKKTYTIPEVPRMNEQDNIAIIKKLYAAFANGDVQTILDNVADNAEWINYGPATIPYAGSRSGLNQVREFFQAIDASTTGGKVTADNFIAQGDTVVATGRYTATVRGTGAQIDTPTAHIFNIRNGKVAKWVGFSDSAKVAEAHTGTSAATGAARR
jgi:uncharacterized protein